MKFWCFLLLFCCISTKVYLQQSYVLDGKVGNYPIVMLLNQTFNKENKTTEVTATYFYKSNRHNIELEGALKGNTNLVLTKEPYDEDSIQYEQFNLKKLSGNNWSGTWKNKKGRLLNVVLQPIDTIKYAFNEVPEIEYVANEERIYTKAQLSGLQFSKDSITHNGIYTLQWMKEKLTKITLFRVTSGYPSNVLQKINQVLNKNQYTNISAAFSCNGRHFDGAYFYDVQKYFFSKTVMSVVASSYYDCGGMHPSSLNDNLNFNTLDGNKIFNLDEIFWFTGKKPPSEKEDNYYEYAEIRAKAIVGIISKLYPKQMRKPSENSEDDCDYSETDHWSYPEWYFTAKGLYVAPTFPHGMAPCSGPLFPIIPYSILKKYQAKGSQLVLP